MGFVCMSSLSAGAERTGTTLARVADDITTDDERDRDPEPDEAPETPLDEPRPPQVQDPPTEDGDNGPYVVLG